MGTGIHGTVGHGPVSPRPGKPSESKRNRLKDIQTVLLVLFVVIVLRLCQVQIISAGKYRAMALKQYQAKMILPPARGIIYDRNHRILADNATYVSYAVDPQVASDDADRIASRFSAVFKKPKRYYLDKLNSDSRFEWLERLVNPKDAAQINKTRFPGLVVRNEPKRIYPCDQVAGQLIGATNLDNKGIAGVELEFDRELTGTPGYIIFQRDGRGKATASVDYPRVEPVSGHSITLTIDKRMQEIAERALANGVTSVKADFGIVVIMQPKTGEILAIGQYPPVDPNNFGKYPPEYQRLRAITDAFEPGSVFKAVTVSAALENKLIDPKQRFDAENGVYTIPVPGGAPRTIRDTHPHRSLSFQEGLEVSSNIVMAKASDIIGSERFYTMARNFGFGIATNVEYPAEQKGTLRRPNEWSKLTLNSMAYGYEVQVTPLQIAAAYCAIANHGVLMQPTLFKAEFGAAEETLRVSTPGTIRQVISERTAGELTKFLEGVVQRGTGIPAGIPGADIAGKTGTARKLVNGQYESANHNASFVGYFPAENPEVVCLVMIDNPRGNDYYGGSTCGPVFKTIARELRNTTDMFAAESPAPPPVQKPVAGRAQVRPISTASINVVPDVRGLSVRSAIRILADSKFVAVITGKGTVVRQDPAPGEPSKPGMKINLKCEPKSAMLYSGN